MVYSGSDELAELEGAIPLLAEPPRAHVPKAARGRRVAALIVNFCVGQGALQLVGVLGGLLLVRRLSVEAYAQLGLAMGFYALIAVLMDLGFASTIVPLVGDRRDDGALVGRYVRAARHLRNRSFWLLAPVAIAAFLAIMHRHHWDWRVEAMLTVSVLLALYSGGKVSYYSAPFFLHGRLREFYLPQVISGAVRLLAYLGLALLGWLNAVTAAMLTTLNVVVNGELLEKRSRAYLIYPQVESAETNREMFQYILPAAPAMIFAAFQSQISLFLVSIFGGTVDVAGVAALGRIGQLFAVLMTFNVIVIEPYFARLDRGRLVTQYMVLLGIACGGCLPLVLLAFYTPGVYLWVLGPKYAGLAAEMGWLVAGACISFVAGTIWIMNRARKWLFWSGTWLEIGLLLVLQAAFLLRYGVRTVHQAVLFTLVTSFGPLLAHGYVSVLGFSGHVQRRNAAVAGQAL